MAAKERQEPRARQEAKAKPQLTRAKAKARQEPKARAKARQAATAKARQEAKARAEDGASEIRRYDEVELVLNSHVFLMVVMIECLFLLLLNGLLVVQALQQFVIPDDQHLRSSHANFIGNT